MSEWMEGSGSYDAFRYMYNLYKEGRMDVDRERREESKSE